MKKQKQQPVPSKKSQQGLYDKLNQWFAQHSFQWLIFVLAVALVAGILQFDIKPSTGGDDTGYVLEAMRIVSKGDIAMGFRPPGYILFLSIFVRLFGIDLVFLKGSSFLCFLGIILIFFFTFRKRLNPVILCATLLLIAINPPMQEYAHTTFSELAYGFFLMASIFFVLKMFDDASWWWIVAAAFFSVMSFYVRIVGASFIGTILLFLLLQRKWKSFGLFLIACIVFLAPWKFLEWHSGVQTFQGPSMYALKNPFNVGEGTETVEGFVVRYANNMINDLNYLLPDALSFPMADGNAAANGAILPNASALFGLFVSAVILLGYVVPIFKKPGSTEALIGLFVPLYVSFVALALQNVYATVRMLVPIVPLLLLGFFTGCQVIGNKIMKPREPHAISKRAKQYTLLAAVVLILLNVIRTKDRIDQNYPTLKANLADNEFAGTTEDWVNYDLASRWVKNNLPIQSTGIICRKPELFFLNAGDYDVYGIYSVYQEHPDSIVAAWKQRHMTHLLYDGFQWTGTLRRYVQPVVQKYPEMFELIHQEGQSERFPSYVFRLNYATYDAKHQQELEHNKRNDDSKKVNR
jgi:hypothetical protein